MKKKLLLLFQVLVSLGLLAWLFGRKDLRGRFAEVITHAHSGWLLLGFLVAGFGIFLGIFRWGIILRMLGLEVSTRDLLRMGLVGLFFNSFLLGAIGGDAVKVLWLAGRGHRKALALMSVAMDRMSGVAALVFCSFLFMTPRLDWLRQSATVASLVQVIYGFVLALAGLLVLSLFLAAKELATRIPTGAPARAQLVEFELAYRQFLEHRRESWLAAGVSVSLTLLSAAA